MKTFDDLLLAYTGRDAAYHESAQTTTGLDFARYVYAAMSAALAEQHRECGEAIASADHAIRLFDEMRNDRDRLADQLQKIAEMCCDDAATDELDVLIASLRMRHTLQLPAGWKLVPAEPTQQMLSEGACASCLPGPHYIGENAAKTAYRNMLAAAPQPPAAEPERQPLTREQREEVITRALAAMDADLHLSWRNAIITEVERAHHIGAEPARQSLTDEQMNGSAARTHMADARLIAAAPDLLEVVNAILRAPSIGSNGPGSSTIVVQDYHLRAARAAVAKAEEGGAT